MDSTDRGKITCLIGKLAAGDNAAAQELWDLYFRRVVGLCRKHLREHPRRVHDEEDAALEAFASFCRVVQAGRYPLLDRDGLWRLLASIALRRASDQVAHEYRVRTW